MVDGMRCPVRVVVDRCVLDDVWAIEEMDLVTLVMGMDQHRAQISAEWIDTITGEISRARVAPADRDGVRKFLGRFAGQDLEVALEATTGWRFVVEELQRIGADVHLAEPAETSALKGKKRRAKTDWADARHQRELLLIGRLPESWIAPAHLLDLRARVRCRHLLSHQRTEWQQRMQAVLYHHGFPQRRDLLSLERREWLAGLSLPAAAREQINISLQIIDALDLQLVPFDQALRAYARKQTGCRTLVREIYGVGELTAVTILAELGDPRRFQNSRDVVRYSGLEMRASNCTSCSGDSGLRDVAGVRDPLPAFLLDLAAERDPQPVGAVMVGGELAA